MISHFVGDGQTERFRAIGLRYVAEIKAEIDRLGRVDSVGGADRAPASMAFQAVALAIFDGDLIIAAVADVLGMSTSKLTDFEAAIVLASLCAQAEAPRRAVLAARDRPR